MNKDEATKQWIAEHTLGDLKPHDGAIKCFREGYEAGQKARLERIVYEINKLSLKANLLDKLKAALAESGE